MYSGTVQRNDDGSYSSSHGHTLTKGPDGQLYSGGAPIGLSAGVGGGAVPTAWTGRETTSSFSTGSVPGTFTTWSSGGWHEGASHTPSVVSSPIYVWMVFLGIAAGVAVSGSPFVVLEGLSDTRR